MRQILWLLARARGAPAWDSPGFTDPIADDAGCCIGTLAYLASVQMLEAGTNGSVYVVVLSCESVLTRITQWVEFVSPMAFEVEPLCG